jgi:hypothetical protein
MNVVRDGIEREDGGLQVFEDGGEVGVQGRPHGVGKERFPVFGRKHEVDQVFGEGLRHGGGGN